MFLFCRLGMTGQGFQEVGRIPMADYDDTGIKEGEREKRMEVEGGVLHPGHVSDEMFPPWAKDEGGQGQGSFRSGAFKGEKGEASFLFPPHSVTEGS